MKQWSIPGGYAQIAIGFIAAFSALLLSLLIAKKYAQLSFRWNQYIYRRMLRLPESFFLNRSSGDVIAKFDNLDDILATSQSSIVTFGISILNIFILLALLANSSLGLLLIAFITVILISGALMRFYLLLQIFNIKCSKHKPKVLKHYLKSFLIMSKSVWKGERTISFKSIPPIKCLYYSNSTRLSLRFSQQDFILSTLDSLSSVLLLVGSALSFIKEI